MSVVTSIVIACPATWAKPQAEYVGRVVYLAKAGISVLDADEDDTYAYVPDDASAGTKYPGGQIYWLGLNHARMDDILNALDADPLCHGAWVWWHGEYDDKPSTHLVGAAASGA